MRNSGSRIFTKLIGFSDFNSFVFDIPRDTTPAHLQKLIELFFVGENRAL